MKPTSRRSATGRAIVAAVRDRGVDSSERCGGYTVMQKGKHLSRLSIVYQANPPCFITTCVQDRQHVLLAAKASLETLVSEWQGALGHYGWAVGSYVVMPDHVHFFCRAANDAVSLSRFVGKWKERTSKRLKALGFPCPLWQKEFFDHVLRSEESYSEKWRYVAENPVRAGLVTRSEDWPYKGHVHYQ